MLLAYIETHVVYGGGGGGGGGGAVLFFRRQAHATAAGVQPSAFHPPSAILPSLPFVFLSLSAVLTRLRFLPRHQAQSFLAPAGPGAPPQGRAD